MPPSGKKHNVPGFLGISFLVHLHVALVIAAILSLNPDGCSQVDLPFAPLEVALVPQDEILRDDTKKEKDLEEEEKKEEEKDKDVKGQVVDLPRPPEEQQPDKARFLSEYDSKVRKETKGAPRRFKPGRMVANRPVPVKQQTRRPIPRKQQRAVERKALKLAMRPRPDIPRSRLEETKTGDEPVSTPAPRDRRPPGPRASEDQREARPSRPVTAKDLKLSDKELIKALGSRVNDYLENVEEGGQTLLNSKRWRFASFFNRVKRQVAENWRPGAVYRRRDPRGNVYGFRDRLTILRVRLTPKGRLKDVHLETASGVGFLDDEAMSAFRAAEPFPNPPRGLVDKDSGMISFRFGFLFEISRRPSFRIFRQR